MERTVHLEFDKKQLTIIDIKKGINEYIDLFETEPKEIHLTHEQLDYLEATETIHIKHYPKPKNATVFGIPVKEILEVQP